MKTRSFLFTLALLALAACRSGNGESRPQTLERTIAGGDPVYLPPGSSQPSAEPKDEPVSTTTTTGADLCSGEVVLKTEAEENACDGGTSLVEKP